MQSPAQIIGSSRGVRFSRGVWFAASLFAATLILVLSLILQTGYRVNQQAIERQRALLSVMLDQVIASQLEDAIESVIRALAQGNTGAPAEARAAALVVESTSRRVLDDVAVVTPGWRLVAGAIEGAGPRATDMAGMKRLLERRGAAALARLGTVPARDDMDLLARIRAGADGHLLVADGKLYVSFVIPVAAWPASSGVGDREQPLLVLGRKLADAPILNATAALRGFPALKIRQEDPGAGEAALALTTIGDRVITYLTWTSDRPGDAVSGRLLPLTSAGFGLVICLFALVVGHQHRLARVISRSEARARAMLGRDQLSGLANRLHFGEQLDLELTRLGPAGVGLAVLFIDLDRFKDVNDTYGHQAGDDLIRLVAERLVRTVQGSDLIARFGGDEFAIIQPGIRTADDAAALARDILDALTRPFMLAHSQVLVGASIGIALAPQHGKRREILMGLADTALYQSKSEGRNRFSLFQDRMDTTIQMRKTVEEDLRRAIEEDQLVLHYQPLFSADGSHIVALEALVRWPHPVRGMINPADFIPIAEERGLVIPLGQWVLRTACRDGKRWPGTRIAVNVSPIEFRQRDFVANVMSTLEAAAFDPHRLELELTEGVVVEDADAAESAMMELRALGIHLALDDFGTGYSSLIYLRRFAFDTIKIDRSFLESMETTGESAILVHSMVHLGRALGLTVTAEGVETPEQHRFLQALGCHQLQGYLFSRPVPAAQIDVMMETSKPLLSAA